MIPLHRPSHQTADHLSSYLPKPTSYLTPQTSRSQTQTHHTNIIATYSKPRVLASSLITIPHFHTSHTPPIQPTKSSGAHQPSGSKIFISTCIQLKHAHVTHTGSQQCYRPALFTTSNAEGTRLFSRICDRREIYPI
jgi:predicted metallo-beta-lactamase superfamily hydrolase